MFEALQRHGFDLYLILDKIGVYKKHALVLVNYGEESGNKIKKLSEEISKSVEKKFGIILEEEVNII